MKSNPSPLNITDYADNVGTNEETDKNLTTPIQSNDNIIWVSAGDITSIDAISPKPSSPDLFDIKPTLQDNGTWLGHISLTAETNAIESYQITYTVDGKQYTQDPKLKINPK